MKLKVRYYAYAALWFVFGVSLLVLTHSGLINEPLGTLGAFGDFFCAAMIFNTARRA